MQHLAIIMDGNGRWAKARHLPRTAGHKKGAETARAVIEYCAKHDIRHLTLYTFSAENWNRPEEEVSELMNLFRFYLGKELRTLHENNIRMRFIGDLTPLSKDIQQQIEQAEALTANNTALTLCLALSYGSRQEITNATRTIAEKVQAGTIDSTTITPELFSSYLYTADIPDPDLLIRTGGEQRISNYLLWQCAYTELYFTEILWPDFGKEELEQALEDFAQRERRFGHTEVPPSHAENTA